MTTTIAYSVGSFIVIVAALVLLRAQNSRFEVKTSDIVVAVVPVLVFLLVTGRLQKFEIGEGGVKIETAFVEASGSAIASQVAPLTGLPTEPIEIDAKAGTFEIPRLIERKTEGLSFRLGRGGYYYGPAIQEYLVQLTKAPYLKYLLIENPDGSFFGSASARDVAATLQSQPPPYTANDLAKWLNDGDKAALQRLSGFIGADAALTKQTDKAQALERMEASNVDTLPVVNEQKRFVGIVDRSRLSASLLIDVSKSLASSKSAGAAEK